MCLPDLFLPTSSPFRVWPFISWRKQSSAPSPANSWAQRGYDDVTSSRWSHSISRNHHFAVDVSEPIGSMVLVSCMVYIYMLTYRGYIDGIHVIIYSSTVRIRHGDCFGMFRDVSQIFARISGSLWNIWKSLTRYCPASLFRFEDLWIRCLRWTKASWPSKKRLAGASRYRGLQVHRCPQISTSLFWDFLLPFPHFPPIFGYERTNLSYKSFFYDINNINIWIAINSRCFFLSHCYILLLSISFDIFGSGACHRIGSLAGAARASSSSACSHPGGGSKISLTAWDKQKTSKNKPNFSLILVDSRWFSLILVDSRWFSLIVAD